MAKPASSRKSKRSRAAKGVGLPSLDDLIESTHVDPHKLKLSQYAVSRTDNEFREDVALLFHAGLYDLVSTEIYKLAQHQTEKFASELTSNLESLDAGNFNFGIKKLKSNLGRLVRDVFLVHPWTADSQSLGVDGLSASIRNLLSQWRHNYRTTDTKSFLTAQVKMKRQLYGQIRLAEDLLKLRFSKTRHAEFKRFIQEDVLKYDRTISLMRGGKAPISTDSTDIESFLKTYRRLKYQVRK